MVDERNVILYNINSACSITFRRAVIEHAPIIIFIFW